MPKSSPKSTSYNLEASEILTLFVSDKTPPTWMELKPLNPNFIAAYAQDIPDHVISAITGTWIVANGVLAANEEESSCVYIINAKADQLLTVKLKSPSFDKSRVVMVDSATESILIDVDGQSPVSALVKNTGTYFLWMVGDTRKTNIEYELTVGTPPTTESNLGSIQVRKVFNPPDPEGIFEISANNKPKIFNADNVWQGDWPDLPEGKYVISEQNPKAGWTKIPDFEVDVVAGQTTHVVLTNTYVEPEIQPTTGRIEITKEVVGSHTGTFTITVDGDEETFDAANKTKIWDNLAPKEYTIQERDPGPGWVKLPDFKVWVDAGQTVKLSLPNTYVPPATAQPMVTPTVPSSITYALDVAGSGSTDGAPLRRRIDSVYSSVTGRSRSEGPDAFRKMLADTFPADPHTGKVVRRPTRTFSSMSAELGRMDVKQLVLSRRVGPLVDNALETINELRAALVANYYDQAKTLLALISDGLNSLKQEARQGGRLLYPSVKGTLDSMEGDLASLEKVLDGSKLSTLESERLDAAVDLLRKYRGDMAEAFHQYFVSTAGQGPAGGSLGSQIDYARTLLQAIANSVRQVEATCDMAGFTLDERRIETINDPEGRPMSIDSILSWVTRTAIDTGPRLLDDAGRPGLERLKKIAEAQKKPIDQLLDPESPIPDEAEGTLEELSNYLERLSTIGSK